MHHVPVQHGGTRIHVVKRTLLRTSAAPNMQVVLSAAPRSDVLNLIPFLAEIKVLLPELFRWKVVRKESVQAVRGPQLALGSAPSHPPALEFPSVSDALVPALVSPGLALAIRDLDADIEASKVLAAVVQQCEATDAGMVELSELDGVELQVVHRLAEQGALTLRTDEFDITEVRPQSSGIKWESVIRCGCPSQAMQAADTFDETSKLDMAVWLTQHGWTPMPNPAAVVSGGPKEFLLEMRRPASYFIVLAKVEAVLQKGVQSIPHDGVDYFYRCLLRLSAERLEGILHVGETTDEYYRKELKAALPEVPTDHVETARGADVPEGVVPITGPMDAVATTTWTRCLVSSTGADGAEPRPHKARIKVVVTFYKT